MTALLAVTYSMRAPARVPANISDEGSTGPYRLTQLTRGSPRAVTLPLSCLLAIRAPKHGPENTHTNLPNIPSRFSVQKRNTLARVPSQTSASHAHSHRATGGSAGPSTFPYCWRFHQGNLQLNHRLYHLRVLRGRRCSSPSHLRILLVDSSLPIRSYSATMFVILSPLLSASVASAP